MIQFDRLHKIKTQYIEVAVRVKLHNLILYIIKLWIHQRLVVYIYIMIYECLECVRT